MRKVYQLSMQSKYHLSVRTLLRLTGTRDRLIGCIEKESILGKDISTCLDVLKRKVYWVRIYQPVCLLVLTVSSAYSLCYHSTVPTNNMEMSGNKGR
jgi:hypothetical protein